MTLCPKISIVTNSFNQAEFLETTIRSILDQNYPNLEYIIIDGGSKDGSVDIIRKHEHRLAYWVSEPDGGRTNGLIKGFKQATGDILGWLCSDDQHEPWTLAEVARLFTENPDWQVFYGDSMWVDRKGERIRLKREIPYIPFLVLHGYDYVPQPSTFWRRNLYERVGGLDPAFRLAMDADLWERFSRVTPMRHVPIRLSRIRDWPGQGNRVERKRSDIEEHLIRERRLGRKIGALEQKARYVLARGGRLLVKGCQRVTQPAYTGVPQEART